MKLLLALAVLAASAAAQNFDPGEILRKAREDSKKTPVVSAGAAAEQASTKIAAPTQALRDSFFGPAKTVLLKKGGPVEDPRCLILSFIAEHPTLTKLDDAAYEKQVDDTIAGTEMYFVDYECRDKLNKSNTDAVAVAGADKKSVGKTCKIDFPDTPKDLMLLWASVNGPNVALQRKSLSPALSAHEVMHLLLKNIHAKKVNDGSMHHGLTNYLQWGKGTPTTAWKPSNDKCKTPAAGSGAQSLSFGVSSARQDGETSDEVVDDLIDVGPQP